MNEKKTLKDYFLWQRVKDECKGAVEKARAEMQINSAFLEKAIEELSLCPKPKEDNSTKK